jgi:uncharacterized protein (TIGR03435 family)
MRKPHRRSRRFPTSILRFIGVLAVVAGTTMPRLVRAQAPSPSPAFEAASVKANTSVDRRVMMQTQPGGRFTATNVTVRDVVREAYRLLPFQLTGEPDWMSRDRFDIVAKGDVDAPFVTDPLAGPSRLQLMLRALLADRFKLVAHEDTRELPVYALTVAKADGRLGSGLRPSTTECATGGRAGAAPAPSQGPDCGLFIGPAKVTGRGVALSQLAGGLAGIAQRTIVDRTGLSGRFDFDLTYTPDMVSPEGAKIAAAGLADANGPSLFTAIQEQLGLKLESTRGPVKVLVVDRVEHPTVD